MWTVVVMLVLLSLALRCFGLFSLDHAAADDAVKAAQVEESNGAEQPHGHNLNRATTTTKKYNITLMLIMCHIKFVCGSEQSLKSTYCTEKSNLQ